MLLLNRSQVICALPLYWRFQQCMKRYYETRKRSPDLWNALKYAGESPLLALCLLPARLLTSMIAVARCCALPAASHSVVIVSSFHPTLSRYASQFSRFEPFGGC